MSNQSLVSPLAVVHPGAKLGENVRVEPFAVIEDNVIIGDNSVIHTHAVIRSGARLGKHCEVHPGAVVANIPQDLKFEGEDTVAIIGDYTTIRECVTINRGTKSRGHTTIGDHCLLMAYSHVAHDCEVGNHVIIGNATQIAGEVEIADYATISGGVLVHQFTRIGTQVMVQGGCRFSKDIPPFTLVGREPTVYCGINIVGLRRRGYTKEQIYIINDIYRTLYQRGLNTTDAFAVIKADFPDSEERRIILDFITSSQRGIIRGNLE
ncbi:UDP-N-acetylglucosamine acyltransferase [Porphyromonas macacae]|uniref:acyl-ACP--UDP-N-acetylglucosamine O-acyltransferase n=1 Tax=Porphyromonas macacae TaxID=28115 RepID=UPI00052BF428|nr:acyl-ACP--UDP-N-acetylglucosamine O-acyltransferase [Porphyromonas macacae]KGN99507.1 UDP-N-acetylglucosamine acyltransferase [Porphyromonas macacae]